MFLKGILRRRPPVKSIVPCWSLELVLDFLSSDVFEPPSKASLADWTLKTAFLLAVTSVSRVSELQALNIRPELSRIRRRSLNLHTNPTFLPKVLKPHYVNRLINIQAFHADPRNKQERKLNTLCPVRAINIYLDKTRPFRKPDNFQLFVSFKVGSEGSPVTKMRISSWIVELISRAYTFSGQDIPQGIRAHSTRAVGTL
jgi:hypothetical protein